MLPGTGGRLSDLKTATEQRPRYIATLVLLLIAITSGTAQTTRAAQTTVIRAVRRFDATSGGLIEKPVVVVKGDRIASVESRTETPPADARLIDLGDATLLSGFIDVHTHLTNFGTLFQTPGAANNVDLGSGGPRLIQLALQLRF